MFNMFTAITVLATVLTAYYLLVFMRLVWVTVLEIKELDRRAHEAEALAKHLAKGGVGR